MLSIILTVLVVVNGKHAYMSDQIIWLSKFSRSTSNIGKKIFNFILGEQEVASSPGSLSFSMCVTLIKIREPGDEASDEGHNRVNGSAVTASITKTTGS